MFIIGEEYKEKIVLEETYEKLNSMWLQKKKTLEKLENEIRVIISLINVNTYTKCLDSVSNKLVVDDPARRYSQSKRYTLGKIHT